MKAWNGILIGVVSSLLTLLLVFALMAASSAAMAHRGEPSELAVADTGQEDASLSPQAGASYYHIPGYVLIPESSATTLAHEDNGCVFATAGAAHPLYAALDIPPGSRVVSFTVFYYDSSGFDLSGVLVRFNSAGTSKVNLAAVASTGTEGYGSRTDDLDHVTDTFGYSYAVSVSFGAMSGSLRVCGIRVMYYPPLQSFSLMPVVTRDVDSP